jgi:hypothetical protein
VTCCRNQRNMCFWHEKWSDWSSGTSLHFCQFCRVRLSPTRLRSRPLGLYVSTVHLGAQTTAMLNALEHNMTELKPIRLKGSFVAHRSGLSAVEGHVRLSPFPENLNFQSFCLKTSIFHLMTYKMLKHQNYKIHKKITKLKA